MNQQVEHTEQAIANANGINIAYDTFGSPDAPPVLLITGIGVQMVVWDEEFCAQLASRGYRVIRFDNRDMGLSTTFPEAGVPDLAAVMHAQMRGESYPVPYTLEDMAKDAIGLLDSLGIESAHVVGASMGGMIGQVMAAHFPDRMRTFTSIMSTTGNPMLPPPQPDALAALLDPVPLERQGYIEAWKKIWRVMSGPHKPLGDELAQKWAELSYERGLNEEGYPRQMAAVTVSGNRKELLKTITVPTLVIHGDSDPLLSKEHGIDQADAIPGSKLLIIEGMGHATPKALWPQLIDAIAQHAK